MRPSFDVLDAPWIPVVRLDGEKELLGIRETLRKAPGLREISTVSPLEEFSVYRFLSVFLMDALRPEDLGNIEEMLEDGSFDMDQIESYISVCKNEGVSFDLFDEKRPFMQSAYVKEWDKEPKLISALDCFLPSGNNHMHFEHGCVEKQKVSVDKAARLLLTIQQFCTVAVQGYPSGVNASPPYFGVVKGNNLFETLVYALLPIQSIEIPFDDPPVIWRSKEVVIPKKNIGQTSWLRGMFFPARRVSLIPPAEGEMISQVYLSQGENFVNKEIWTDPFVSYRTLDTGRVPLRPKGEKPAWRSLFEIVDIRGNHASQILSQFIRLTDRAYAYLTFYGVETSRASYLDVMRCDLRFRREITEQEDFVKLLKASVKSAEQLARKLRYCLRDGNLVPENASNAAIAYFYSQCEGAFWRICEDGTSGDDTQALYRDWCKKIGHYAQESYDKAMEGVNLRGKALGQDARQKKWLYVEIKKIKEEAEG